MFQRFARAWRLPLDRKILFARVSLQLLAVHLALRLFPFIRVYRFLKNWHRAPRQEPTALPQGEYASAPELVCWAVTRAGKTWLGDQGCLAQALLGEMLLVRIGVPARLRIGVRKDKNGALFAHAWVEENGRICIGGKNSLIMKEFQNLPEIQRIIEQQGGA